MNISALHRTPQRSGLPGVWVSHRNRHRSKISSLSNTRTSLMAPCDCSLDRKLTVFMRRRSARSASSSVIAGFGGDFGLLGPASIPPAVEDGGDRVEKAREDIPSLSGISKCCLWETDRRRDCGRARWPMLFILDKMERCASIQRHCGFLREYGPFGDALQLCQSYL